MFLKNEFSNRLVQVSLFAGIVYYITAYPVVFESARKYFPIKFKKTHHLLIFHTFVFAVLMYVLTYFVFDPIVRVVEGGTGGPALPVLGSKGNPIKMQMGDSNTCKLDDDADSGKPSVIEGPPKLGKCNMKSGREIYYSCIGGNLTLENNRLKC